MSARFPRRTFLAAAPAAGLGLVAFGAPFTSRAARAADAPTGSGGASPVAPHLIFPRQDEDLVYQVVGAAHSKLDVLTPLVEARPTLALATVDWGFGDWETALGAASHVGRPDIAEFLMQHGARPDQFTFAMLGRVDALRAMIAAHPGLQRDRGPHGITLLQHAKNGGDPANSVVEYLESLGDADPKYRDDAVSDADKAALLGEYTFGTGPTDVFIVKEGMGGVTLSRKDGFPRRLFHQGDLTFFPGGAVEVVVRFERDGERIARVHVVDATIRVTATRAAS